MPTKMKVKPVSVKAVKVAPKPTFKKKVAVKKVKPMSSSAIKNAGAKHAPIHAYVTVLRDSSGRLAIQQSDGLLKPIQYGSKVDPMGLTPPIMNKETARRLATAAGIFGTQSNRVLAK